MRCPSCGCDNPKGAIHCGDCGVALSTELPGLTLREALSWRETFERIGWLETPPLDDDTTSVLHELHISLDVRSATGANPWVLCCSIKDSPGKVTSVSLNKSVLAGVLLPGTIYGTVSKVRPKGYLFATRTHLGCLGKRPAVFAIADIRQASAGFPRFGKQSIDCKLAIGADELTFRVRSPESGTFRRAARANILLYAENSALSVHSAERKGQFVRLLDSFLQALCKSI